MEKDNKDSIIKVTEDRVRLTLKNYQDNKALFARFSSYFGMVLTLLITFFTAEYKPFLGFTKEQITILFFVLLIIFALLMLKNFIHIIINIFKHRGSEGWFICELKGIKFEKETHFEIPIEEIGNGIRIFFRWFLQILFYALPIGIMLIIGFAVGWNNIIWEAYIFFGIIGLISCYWPMFQFWNEITEFFEDLFDGLFF